ncbi:GIY-YIG nuclease family protein [Streptococcus uberis]|uniref:GIY-YIG nuclease family protein n=1 Tax=Streptococcus uberis TaxID=1349 RepID=UPI0027DC12B0|nr:GIY-YIG nuclease family protein [Streptococcus uberis]MCK1238618.1 GIY-YIG nuclease family protein [Streptococcus uberis]
MKEAKSFMYVLECSDKTLYTGYTTDVNKRLETHNSGKGAKYTKARLPVKLLYVEAFNSKQEAMSAEALFKKRKSRAQKLAYISEQQKKD